MMLAPQGHPSAARRRLLSALVPLTAALVVSTAHAQLPTARLQATYPTGGQAGSQFDLTVTSGTDIEGLTQLHFSHPEITAAPKTQQAEGQDQPTPIPNQFVVAISDSVPPGVYELRASGAYGITNPRAFVVGHRPETHEVESNNLLDQATAIALDQVVNGRSDAAKDVDYFQFAAQKDQRIVLDCAAQRIDSRMDATLELYDHQHNLLALSRDVNGRDPLIEFTVPADGQYFVRIYDFVFGGSQEHFYRLSVSSGPYIDFIFPPSGLPGTTATYTLFGRNLPNGSPADGVTIDGRPLEQMQVEITLPAEADQLATDSPISAAQSMLDGVDYRLSTPHGISNSVWLPFATAPLAAEQEPNDTADSAQAVQVPCEITGQFQQTGDEDWFVFDARQGQVYWLEVFADRLGQALDPFFVLERVAQDDQGNVTVTNITEQDDFAGGTPAFPSNTGDPVFRFEVPADGTYRLMVRDLYHETRGDPSCLYRFSLRHPRPDFRVVAVNEFPQAVGTNPMPAGVVPWTAFVYRGGAAGLTLVTHRLDGFAGEIVVSASGLPSGVTAQDTVIGPSQSRATMIFTAAADATDWAGHVQLTARSKLDDVELQHQVRGATYVWPPIGTLPNARVTRDVALAVGQQAPVSLNVDPRQFSVPQGQLLSLSLALSRQGDDQKNAFTFTAAELPGNVQNEAIKIEAEATAETLRLFVPHDCPPGTHTFFVQMQGPINFTKNADGSDKKPIAVNEPGPSVTLTVTPGPVELAPAVPNKGELKRGAQMEVPVTVKRRNGFAGAVALDLLLLPHLNGITAEPVNVAADADQAKLVISTTADATEGTHSHVVLRARCGEGDSAVEVHQIIPLVVKP